MSFWVSDLPERKGSRASEERGVRKEMGAREERVNERANVQEREVEERIPKGAEERVTRSGSGEVSAVCCPRACKRHLLLLLSKSAREKQRLQVRVTQAFPLIDAHL